jgi:hypothetical protein
MHPDVGDGRCVEPSPTCGPAVADVPHPRGGAGVLDEDFAPQVGDDDLVAVDGGQDPLEAVLPIDPVCTESIMKVPALVDVLRQVSTCRSIGGSPGVSVDEPTTREGIQREQDDPGSRAAV